MNVTLNVSTTPVALPAGITAGQLSFSITAPTGKPVNDANGTPIAAQAVPGTQAIFANVAPGDYVASAVRMDTSGNAIGVPNSQAFTVPSPVVQTYDAPQSITVTLA